MSSSNPLKRTRQSILLNSTWCVFLSPGLGDTREAQLLSSLAALADDLRGEMMLGALCEEAVEQLTGANSPDGACTICMSDLDRAASGSDADTARARAEAVVKLPCYHCFHM